MGINWGGKKWRPADMPKKQPKINQSIDELLKPLSEKSFKGNVWGSQIMNVEKDVTPIVSPSPTPTVTPTQSVTPSITPSVTPSISVTPTPTITPTPSSTPPTPLSFQQTDSTFTNGGSSACSSATAANINRQLIASIGGTPGTTSFNTRITDGPKTNWIFQFKLPIPSGTTWNAGTWTWRFRVSATAGDTIRLKEVYICRVNSSDVSQSIIGSDTSLNINLNTLSTYSGTISGISQTPSAGDYVNIVFVGNWPNAGNAAISIRPEEIIDSPYT